MKAIEVLNEVYGKNPKNTDVYYPITVILEAMEIYANQPKWISVEDSLPPEKVMKISEDVIVYDGKDVFVDCYDYEFNQWCRFKYKSTITHWQPLPTFNEKKS